MYVYIQLYLSNDHATGIFGTQLVLRN